jgi:hypothetical protein
MYLQFGGMNLDRQVSVSCDLEGSLAVTTAGVCINRHRRRQKLAAREDMRK